MAQTPDRVPGVSFEEATVYETTVASSEEGEIRYVSSTFSMYDTHGTATGTFDPHLAALDFLILMTTGGVIVNSEGIVTRRETPATGDEEMLSGSIIAYGGGTAPTGYLLCDGTSYTTAAEADLFAAIGYAFGGSGANFNVPDLRSRIPVGAGPGPGLTARTLAATGGAESITSVPSHVHSIVPPCSTDDALNDDPASQFMAKTDGALVYLGTSDDVMASFNSASTGSASVDVMNPFAAVTFIIKS